MTLINLIAGKNPVQYSWKSTKTDIDSSNNVMAFDLCWSKIWIDEIIKYQGVV